MPDTIMGYDAVVFILQIGNIQMQTGFLANICNFEIRRNARWLLRLTVLWVLLIGNCHAKSPPVLIFDKHGVQSAAWLNYQIELYADGSVHYYGVDDVNVIGDRYGKIKPKQVQYLVDLFQKLYQKRQQELSEFMARYDNRHNLSQEKQRGLEFYKERYIDDRDWDTSITYLITHDSQQLPSIQLVQLEP